MLIDAVQKSPNQDTSNINIGKGVGVKDMDDDGSNSDFFRALLPSGQ